MTSPASYVQTIAPLLSFNVCLASMLQSDPERVRNAAQSVPVDNETTEWDCQDYVLEILDPRFLWVCHHSLASKRWVLANHFLVLV
jgi:hypothetical protein